MAYRVKYFCLSIAPKAVFEASVEMWKGNFQFVPLRMGASDIFSFNDSKTFPQSEFQLNSQSFVSNLKSGDAISVIFYKSSIITSETKKTSNISLTGWN